MLSFSKHLFSGLSIETNSQSLTQIYAHQKTMSIYIEIYSQLKDGTIIDRIIRIVKSFLWNSDFPDG